MYSDSDDSMSSDSSMDLPGPKSMDWLDKNPLSRIRLDNDLDHLVTPHLGRWHVSPFDAESIKTGAAVAFYTSFFLGLMTTYDATASSGLLSTYRRKSSRKLEIAAVFSKGQSGTAMLHIHEINFHWIPNTANEQDEPDEIMREGRIEAIKKKLQSSLRNSHEFNEEVIITEAQVYRYELNEQPTERANVGLELELYDRAYFELTGAPASVSEADERAADEYFAGYKSSGPTLDEHWKNFVNNVLPGFQNLEDEPSVEEMQDIIQDSMEYFLEAKRNVPKPLISLHEGASDLGFLHGALFTAMPDKYYKRVMSTDMAAIYHSGGHSHLYFVSSSRTPHRDTIVDMDDRPVNFHFAYEAVRLMKDHDDEADVEEIRCVRYGDTHEIRMRILKWNVHNVLKNLITDMDDVEPDHEEQFKINHDYYLQLIQSMVMDEFFGNSVRSLQTLRAFLFGQLVTYADIIAMHSPIDNVIQVIHLNSRHEYYITFSNQKRDTSMEELLNNHEPGNQLFIEFSFNDGQIGWHLTSVNPSRINVRGLEPIANVDLRQTLKQISSSENTPESDVANLRQKFHNQLRIMLQTMKREFLIENAADSFLAGALSNVGLKEFQSYDNPRYGTTSSQSSLSVGKERFYFDWITVYSNRDDLARHAIEGIENDHNSFNVVNRLALQDGTVEVGAWSSRQRHFNTENVNRLCQANHRTKRGISYCEQEIEEKIDYEDIHQRIQDKNPTLSEHLSILHEVSGNLQLAFIGRDMFGDIYQGNMEGLARDALFFGATSLGSKVGQSIAALGRSQKAAGRTILGGVMETLGGCAAMVGFDVYMGYQMKEEIKRNDTTSAIYSGAYIGMDIVECGAIALAAFGLMPFLPEIVAVVSVFRVSALIAQNVQETKHKIEEIEAIVPLTPEQETVEYFREFFHLGTDPKIESMIDEVTANEAVVLNMVAKYPEYDQYMTSAAYKIENRQIVFIDDNNVDLSKTHHFHISTLMPRHNKIPKDLTTFCSMDEAQNPNQPDHSKGFQAHPFVFPSRLPDPKPYTNPTDDFYCSDSFGVRKAENHTPQKTLYQLYNGTDNIVAFPTGNNIFLLMNGNKSIHGGVGNDVFAIQADYIFGYLNGSAGDDTVDFSASDGGKDLVIRNGEAVFSPMHGNNNTLKLYNIETVIGRSSLTDYIEVCNEKMIDLGGATYGMDRINISKKCPTERTNLTVVLRKNTHITCDDQDSSVRYIVTDGSENDLVLNAGSHELRINFASYFDLKMQRIDRYNRELEFSNSSTIVRLYTAEILNITFQFLKENLTMKIDDHENVTLYVHGMNNIFDVIEKYAEYLEDKLHVKLIAKGDFGTIILKHNFWTVDFDGKQRILNLVSNGHQNAVQMIGHGGVDNYFWISAKLNKPINITIHPQLNELSSCYIDLHNLTREINHVRNGSLGLSVRTEIKAGDIILKIYATSSTEKIDNIIRLGSINIRNSSKYMEQITVYLYAKNKFSTIMNKTALRPTPLPINQTFLAISPGQFEIGSQINFSYPSSNLTAYRMDASLILTNVVVVGRNSHQQPITIVLSEFFTYRAKYDTLSLIFDGRILDVSELAFDAESIKSMWKKIRNAIDETKNGTTAE